MLGAAWFTAFKVGRAKFKASVQA